MGHETDISAKPPQKKTASRLPRADGHQSWSSGVNAPSQQGPQEAVSVTDAPESDRATDIKRLTRRSDYLALRRAPATRARAFVLAGQRRYSDETRVGLTVTKKIGGAVTRNRIKRRLREAVREVFPDNAVAGCDYVLIARSAAAKQSYASLLDDLKRALLSLNKKLI